MDSKIFIALAALVAFTACQPAGTTVSTDSNVSYWHQTRITADNAPDVVKAQDILESDLTECGFKTRMRNHLADVNDPVSTVDGHVVDEKGKSRANDTTLPTLYQVSRCMDDKGWVRLKHYYTTPY